MLGLKWYFKGFVSTHCEVAELKSYSRMRARCLLGIVSFVIVRSATSILPVGLKEMSETGIVLLLTGGSEHTSVAGPVKLPLLFKPTDHISVLWEAFI